ncbi:MAG: hypothetical protein R3254_02805 [Thiomicrorhabdus sp.]|nr:hypothetical protein [Thiomicrorhabdus sp.]
MSESKGLKPGLFYKFFQTAVFIGVPVSSYLILDWGFLQIFGAIIVMSVAFEIDEKGSTWRRWMWALLSFDVMVLGHLFIDDSIMNWGLVFLSAVLIIIVLMILVGIKDYKAGDGSTITHNYCADYCYCNL